MNLIIASNALMYTDKIAIYNQIMALTSLGANINTMRAQLFDYVLKLKQHLENNINSNNIALSLPPLKNNNKKKSKKTYYFMPSNKSKKRIRFIDKLRSFFIKKK